MERCDTLPALKRALHATLDQYEVALDMQDRDVVRWAAQQVDQIERAILARRYGRTDVTGSEE